MNSAPPPRPVWSIWRGGRFFFIAAISTLVAQLILLGMRIQGSISWKLPLLVMTSGREEEALFGIWKAANGQDVYAPWDAPPFAASYYNWLFYQFYGAVSACVMKLMELDDVWLPTIAHTLTLALLPILAVCFWRNFTALAIGSSEARRGAVIMLAAIMASGPLMGWWLLAARSDVASLCLELFAFGLCLKYIQRPDCKKLAAIILVSYAAWSFRQISVHVIGGFCLFLLVKQFHRAWIYAVLGTFGLYAATMIAGGEGYRANIITANTAWPVSAQIGLQNLFSACAKAPLLPAAGLVLAMELARWRSNWHKMPAHLLLTVLTVCWSLPWDCFCCSKMAASDNYFFFSMAASAMLLWQCFLGRGLCFQRNETTTNLFTCLVLLQGMATLLPVLHIRGETNLLASHSELKHAREILRQAPAPAFASRPEWNLPWINPSPPHAVFTALIDEEYIGSTALKKTSATFNDWLASKFFSSVVLDRRHTGPLDEKRLRTGFHKALQSSSVEMHVRN